MNKFSTQQNQTIYPITWDRNNHLPLMAPITHDSKYLYDSLFTLRLGVALGCFTCAWNRTHAPGIVTKMYLLPVLLNCGQTSSENNTFLIMGSTSAPTTSVCTYTICETNANICRLRLDFTVSPVIVPAKPRPRPRSALADVPEELLWPEKCL